MDRLYKRRGWARRAATKAGRWWIAVEHPYRSGYFIRQMTPIEKAQAMMQLDTNALIKSVYERIGAEMSRASVLYGRM